MTTEVFFAIGFACVQIPVAILGATMPETRSKTPPIIAGASAVLILVFLTLFYGEIISGSQLIYGSIFATDSIGVAVWFILKGRHKTMAVQIQSTEAHFSKTDAWELYRKFNESIRQIRTLAKVTDTVGREFFRNEQYLKIKDGMAKDREKCTDNKLNEMLVALEEHELHCAEFGFSPIENPYAANYEFIHQKIRDHINKMR